MKIFNRIALCLALLVIAQPADATIHDNPLAPVIAFLAGCGVNAGLKKHPKVKKTVNCVIGGAYLIAPVVNMLGFAVEQTFFKDRYKNETYNFGSMFPALFLCYLGGAVTGDVIAESHSDKDMIKKN